MRKLLLALAGLALIASGGLASVATVSGADHRDSPINVANPTADINDIYAFRSTENGNNLVVAISVNPLIAPSDNASRGVFDPGVQYQVHIDRNADLQDDATVTIRATTQPQNLIVEGLGSPITAAITPPGASAPVITNAGGVKVFAGLRDDPFFFDLTGFQAFVANPQAPARGLRPASAGAPQDFFAGMNVLAIVLEVPVTAVTGGANANSGSVKVWVSTSRNGSRIDRMAIPAINTALIPSASKDAFNLGSPATDAAAFQPAAVQTIRTLRGAVDSLFSGAHPQDGGPLGSLTPEQVAGALVPDVVTLDFSRALQFPNGRRLQDDVIDTALGVVLNRGGAAGISDGVNANDRPFSASFPYLADPATPPAGAAAPQGPIRPPSTGEAGLVDSGAMWRMSALMFALAVLLGGAGVLAAVRGRGR